MAELFASLFSTDDVGQISVIELILTGSKSEELRYIGVTRDEVQAHAEELKLTNCGIKMASTQKF